jgi:branched-chain amino acid transport system ATP-binding protein
MGLGYVPEERRIFSELTVAENLEVGKQPPRDGGSSWNVDRVVALFPALTSLLDRLGGQISGGEQQMLTIARTLMGNPDLLLLDEPGEGLAPIVVERMLETLLALKRDGLSLLLSDQNVHFAQALADRVYILETGVVRYSGTVAELAHDAATRRRYLAI